jgi:hypothetical protein
VNGTSTYCRAVPSLSDRVLTVEGVGVKMAASSLCRLQGLERTLALAVPGPIVNHRASAFPLTNAGHVRKGSWAGLPVLPFAPHIERARRSSKEGHLVCKAETGKDDVAKQSTLGNSCHESYLFK